MRQGNGPIASSSHWGNLLREVWKRCYLPLGHPTFIVYFLIIIVVFGGLGVLIKLYRILSIEPTDQDKLALAQDLSTYLLAVIAASFVDLDFSESSNLRSLRMLALALLLIGGMCGVISQVATTPRIALFSATLGTMLGLFLWWIANYDNTKLIEKDPDPKNPVGGSPRDIQGNARAAEF